MKVTGLASVAGRTLPTKSALKELIKTDPSTVILVPVHEDWTPGDFAAKGPADKLPAGIEFVIKPWHGKWSATVYHGKNGLTVK